MNYRHIFHAGNFADLLKHAVLTALLADMTRGRAPLTVIDTHAGAGLYDVGGDLARRTGEGTAAGVLMADAAAPTAFDALKAAVRRANETGVRFYPGSPALVAAALRDRDQLIACEIQREDYERLRHVLKPAGAFAVREDGWEVVRRRTPRAPVPTLVLIDPPYEARDDGARAVEAMRQVVGRNPGAVVAVWAPIKDLTTFDSLIGGLEEAARGRDLLVVEARLRPLHDPMRLNGCAMVVANPPPGLEAAAGIAAAWIAGAFGEAGAVGRASLAGRSSPARTRK